jgi:hypothetical protein
MEEFASAFHAARCVSTPLVAVRSADPASTTHFIIETLKQGRELPPLLGWDVVRGLYAIGRNSGDELARVLGERQAATIGLVDALFLAQQLGEDGLLFYSNAHRFWMESSLVGASTERLRTALQIIDAVSQGRMLFIATCNSIASLPPELRRRFTLGTFFFDLPSEEERETIWGIYLKKYNVSGQLPNDEGWTGVEIKECCRKAHRLGITLMQAARYIVPVSRFAAEQIKALRQMASGKFISASTPGRLPVPGEPPRIPATRHARSGWAAHRYATLEIRGLNTPCQTMPGSQLDFPQRVLTHGSRQARVLC